MSDPLIAAGGPGSPFDAEDTRLSRLKEKYEKEVVPTMMKEFGYKSIMAVPRAEKVVLNMGLGEAISNIKVLDKGVEELSLIAGQKAVVTNARRSIAGFKLRQGMPIGCTVTLRRQRMYDFLDRFISLALPRIRDFKGIPSKSFDGRGNYAFGIKEQIIFPEIDYDKVVSMHGMDVVIVTTAKTNEESKALLKHLGMPFEN